MGILPLQFLEGQNAESLNINGTEKFTIDIDDNLQVKQLVNIKVI
jgi:aconitate hydratase